MVVLACFIVALFVADVVSERIAGAASQQAGRSTISAIVEGEGRVALRVADTVADDDRRTL